MAGGWANWVNSDRGGTEHDAKGWVNRRAEDEFACGDGAVVQDVVDIGHRGETAHYRGIVCISAFGGVDDSHFETIMTTEKASAGGMSARVGVAGHCGVTVNDDVMVRNDGSIELRVEPCGRCGEQKEGNGAKSVVYARR